MYHSGYRGLWILPFLQARLKKGREAILSGLQVVSREEMLINQVKKLRDGLLLLLGL